MRIYFSASLKSIAFNMFSPFKEITSNVFYESVNKRKTRSAIMFLMKSRQNVGPYLL